MVRGSAALLSACLAFGGHAQADDPSPAFAIPTDATCDEAVAEWDRYQAFVAKNRKTRRLMREKFKSAATADEFCALSPCEFRALEVSPATAAEALGAVDVLF